MIGPVLQKPFRVIVPFVGQERLGASAPQGALSDRKIREKSRWRYPPANKTRSPRDTYAARCEKWIEGNSPMGNVRPRDLDTRLPT